MKRWLSIVLPSAVRPAVAALALALAGAIAAVSATSPPALAQSGQEMRTLLNRVERLERDISTLNLQVSRGGSAASPAASAGIAGEAVAPLYSRLSTLEDDIRATTGGLEQVGQRIRQLEERLDKLVGDMDFRLSTLERGALAAGAQAAAPTPPAGPPGAGVPPPPGRGILGTITDADLRAAAQPTPAPSAAQAAAQPRSVPAAPPPRPRILPEGAPQDQYAYAFALLRQANYDQAELALREFLALNASDALAVNARYWLGETYYVRRAYLESAQVFLEAYQAAPKSPKAPDALLKLGMSLAQLDKKKDACAAFDKLAKEFPEAAAGFKTTVDKERQRSGCR